MVSPATIHDMVLKALAEATKRDPSEIALAHSFRHDLGLNSLDTIELMYRVEEAFDLMIPDTDLPKLGTVGSLIQYLQSRVSSGTVAVSPPMPSPPPPPGSMLRKAASPKPTRPVRSSASRTTGKKRLRA